MPKAQGKGFIIRRLPQGPVKAQTGDPPSIGRAELRRLKHEFPAAGGGPTKGVNPSGGGLKLEGILLTATGPHALGQPQALMEGSFRGCPLDPILDDQFGQMQPP